jgi:hypothetical protein
MQAVHENIAKPLRALPSLTQQELQRGDVNKLAREWWEAYDQAFAEAERLVNESAAKQGVPPTAFAPHLIEAAAKALGRTPDGLRRSVIFFLCELGECEGEIKRTGNRGPWPKLCPYHRDARRRERTRSRVRKHRGDQQVLLRFDSARNADAELRSYSVVDVDLAQERPEDTAGQWCDNRATWWIEHCPQASREWQCLSEAENAAMLRAASVA